MLHWSWGLSTAVLLTLVIWLNGHQVRAGWLLGAGVQLVNVGFGWWVYGSWQFAFLLLPAGMFVWIWWRVPQHQAERELLMLHRLVEQMHRAGWRPPPAIGSGDFMQDRAAFRAQQRMRPAPERGFKDIYPQ